MPWNSSASCIARRSPCSRRPSVTTRMREPSSGTSAYGKQCAIDTDSTPSCPSRAEILSTKPRMGCSVVGKLPIMRQSASDITGRISPRIARSVSSTTSSPRSTKSVWGNSLKQMISVALRTRLTVMWQCGSSSTPIGTSGPTMARTCSRMSPSQSSQPSATMAPCMPSSTPSTGMAARSCCSTSSRKVSKASRETRPAGSAKVQVPSIRVQPSSRARRRATHTGAVHSFGSSGCCPGAA